MDTALSEIMVFKLFRAETATGTVTTPAIVITLDIIKHCRPHYFLAGKAFSVDILHFQREKEAFNTGIVIAAALCTHAPPQIMTFQQSLIISLTVLATTVGMKNDIFRIFTPPKRHLQCIAGKLCRHTRQHRPANDSSRPQINHHHQIHPAFIRTSVGDVTCPLLVWAAGVKILFQQIL